eukprot:CAMPEP_0194201624 /NCGR_PEP_ID=MMETSP0156-20130528/1843_1 /TAXON_ID=33649 /ORGANISM="Thalassionema nitzschioides, Strain L26-B" /LENGTH=355 /DNA_ID=CAMNT_0038926859 /DNA_START=24 /DNA_END=1091 /DNA_ORIENTATION=-
MLIRGTIVTTKQAVASSSLLLRRSFSNTKTASTKVAVLGAAGGIGQPLSLLLKTSAASQYISELACYDIVGTPGVAADLSHVPTFPLVRGHLPSSGTWPPSGNTGLEEALTGADVVVIPAGVPRKPGMTRDDLFNTNASIVRDLVAGCADFCPEAQIAIISNPVNSTVPIASAVLKQKGCYDPKKLSGVTTLDVIRANTFLSSHCNTDPSDTNVTVIGGHAGITILPLFSQTGATTLSDDDREALTVRTQFGGDEVVQAKAGAGSATLSMAYAGYLFTQNLVQAKATGESVVQCAFVESSVTEAPFFASPVKYGPNGIEEVLDFGAISDYEQAWLNQLLPDLKKQIQKGLDFVEG